MKIKKKILFILPGFGFGGTVFSTLNMISLIKDKYDIYVIPMHPFGPVKAYYNDINIIMPSLSVMAVSAMPVSKDIIWYKQIIIYLLKLINHICIKYGINYKSFIYKRQAKNINTKFNFDIVASCQEFKATEFASFFSVPNLIAWNRTEMSIHINKQNTHDMNLMFNVYKKFNSIVSVSKTTSDDFSMCFPELKEKCIAIHNVQNIERIILKSKHSIADAFEKDIFNIVSVGRIAKQKQFNKIPKIAHKLHTELGLKFKWYIIGDGNIQGENDRLQEELYKYNNRDYVICIGSRLNPYPYIANADLLVNTSYYEACPRVVAEAQILHTPVVCADFSSAHEFVNNNVNGFVESIDNLWEPISRLINDRTLYNRIKFNCLNFQSENQIILKQLYDLFDNK